MLCCLEKDKKWQKHWSGLRGYTKQEYFEFKCSRYVAFLIEWVLPSNAKHVYCYDLWKEYVIGLSQLCNLGTRSWSNQLPTELEIYLIHFHLVFKVFTNYNKFHLYSVQRNEHIQMPASLHYLLSERRMTSSELFNFWRSKLRPINISQR